MNINYNLKRLFKFSGGRSSAMACLVEDPQPEDLILFNDTGRESPGTYKFISDFEKNEGLKVHTSAYEHSTVPILLGFDALNAYKEFLPNRVKRICTYELKVQTTKRYLRTIGWKPNNKFIEVIGYRSDEKPRVDRYKPTWKSVTPSFPLYEKGVNKAMVLDYWKKKSYDLEIPSILGNCDLCFLKGKNAIIRILQHYPELADRWIKDEEEMSTRKNNGKAQYFKDVTYRQLLNAAQNQKLLFDKIDLGLVKPEFSCSCTSNEEED